VNVPEFPPKFTLFNHKTDSKYRDKELFEYMSKILKLPFVKESHAVRQFLNLTLAKHRK